MKRTIQTTSILAALAALPACAEPSADLCIAERFDAQPSQRFVAGETYYLPVIGEDSRCAEVRWTVVERPDESRDPIVKGNDSIWRITPTVPGRYRFSLAEAGDGETLELMVVAASERPFHNLNYYPGRSLAQVGDELWVANVQAPTISRVDPSSLQVIDEIAVGPWPVALAWAEGMDVAVVAQRGSDTLGVIDLASNQLIDAIWVGDEPANVVVSPDGSRAYVALAGEDAVAVVDLAKRVRTARIEGIRDPLAMALAPDGASLWVAAHRSGHPSRFPYESDPVDEERDVVVIDTATAAVVDSWIDVGATITGLLVSADGERLYMARRRNDTEPSLADPEQPNFFHEVALFDATSGEELASADLTRQLSSGGHAVSVHGLTLAGGRLWVAAEGSDLSVALDPDSLAELGRVETLGRPRSVTAIGDTVYVHGAQATVLTAIAGLGETPEQLALTVDPRPADLAAGQYYFTGAGEGFAQSWSCNSCHDDGLGDTLIWNAGPFFARYRPAPFFWLEGTYPLGVDGYVSSVDNFAFTVNTNVGVRPTTDEYQALSAYLASIMPPPAANGFTRRDGSLSELGQRGRELFEGEAGCVSCHPLPLTTNRMLLEQGITEDDADVPSLIGAYRHGVWLKHGEATSLSEAVDLVFARIGDPDLSTDDRAALERFLLELTARDFMVLVSDPLPGSDAASVVRPLTLSFSHPVYADPQNLAKVTLVDASGAEVDVSRELAADGRHLTLTLAAPLEHGAGYTLVIDPSFESFAEQRIWSADPAAPTAWEIPFTTAAAPTLRLAGEYWWTVDMPALDLDALEFDFDNIIKTLVTLEVSEDQGGGLARFDYGQELGFERPFIAAGEQLWTPALPIPVGPSFADSTGIQGATLIDEDDDGIADAAEGTLTISGPGFRQSDVHWRLSRPGTGECVEGSEGALAINLELGPDGPIVDWGSPDADGLGVYFIGPDAQPPAGPGQPVTGGEVYWGLQVAEFPNGFAGPVSYGVVPEGAIDDTTALGGGDGPATLESGDCVKVHVITTAFTQGSVTFIVP